MIECLTIRASTGAVVERTTLPLVTVSPLSDRVAWYLDKRDGAEGYVTLGVEVDGDPMVACCYVYGARIVCPD